MEKAMLVWQALGILLLILEATTLVGTASWIAYQIWLYGFAEACFKFAKCAAETCARRKRAGRRRPKQGGR